MNDQKKPSTSPAPARHGLRLIKTAPGEQLESTLISQANLKMISAPKARRPNALASQLSKLADALDAEVEMILKI